MTATENGHLDCLFDCGLKFSSLESLHLHIEVEHREDNAISPFLIRDAPSPPSASHYEQVPPVPRRPPPEIPTNDDALSSHESEPDAFVQCPEEGCGEQLLLIELSEHLDLHEAENFTSDDTSPTSQQDSKKPVTTTHYSASPTNPTAPANSGHTQNFSTDLTPALKRKMDNETQKPRPRINMGRKFLSLIGIEKNKGSEHVHDADGVRKLGKNALGPYADEEEMPYWLYKRLKEGPKIHRTKKISRNGRLTIHEAVEGESTGVMPVLKKLIGYDLKVYMAYLCHPSVAQIGKFYWEGGFCGYRNMQMQVSYMQNAKHPAGAYFPGRVPGVLDLQEMIENAWDNGVNWFSRLEVGQLKKTRKWIGTLEVHAVYQNLGIDCKVHQFNDSKDVYAEENLLDWVEKYFKDAALSDGKKVQCTLKPPIYFQRPGHSMTIVGLEIMKDGTRNLLVFDPMYQAPKSMKDILERGGERRVAGPNNKLLTFYRRSQYRLQQYLDFETLELTGDLPMFPTWDVGRGHS